jgi:hypothetical protein
MGSGLELNAVSSDCRAPESTLGVNSTCCDGKKHIGNCPRITILIGEVESHGGVDENYTLPADKKGASEGAIAMIYVSGFGWALGIRRARLRPMTSTKKRAQRIAAINFMIPNTAVTSSRRELHTTS